MSFEFQQMFLISGNPFSLGEQLSRVFVKDVYTEIVKMRLKQNIYTDRVCV